MPTLDVIFRNLRGIFPRAPASGDTTGGGGSDPGDYPAATNIDTGHDTVPNFARFSQLTVYSVGDGDWLDTDTWNTNAVPTDDDIVGIMPGHTVTYNADSTDVIKALGIAGKLAFDASIDTQLWVQHAYVYDIGELEIGTAATPIDAAKSVLIVTPDVALESSGVDPSQYGNGWHVFGKIRVHGAVKTKSRRATGHISAAATTITLGSAPSGWRAGDRLLLPDTRLYTVDNGAFQNEVVTFSSLASATATVSEVANGHEAWVNGSGVVSSTITCHVANLTRNIVFKSENANPTHARGHMMFHPLCNADIRYMRRESLGRTKWTTPTATTTNQKGRYPGHWHHVIGPVGGIGYDASVDPDEFKPGDPANINDCDGPAFREIGCVTEDMATEQRKWGIVLHDAHFGLIKDNIIYHCGGSCIYSEQGNESWNVLDGNLTIGSQGNGHRGDGHYPASGGENPGLEGVGLWLAGMNNYVRNHVSGANSGFNYGIYNGDFPETGFGHASAQWPDFQGADPDDDGHSPPNGNTPMLEFLNNEGFNADINLNPWFIGADYTIADATIDESLIEGFLGWHCARGMFQYPSQNFRFLDCRFYGKFSALSNSSITQQGYATGDYLVYNQTWENCEFRGLRAGILAPVKPGDVDEGSNCADGGLYQIIDCTFQCINDILANNLYAVTGGGIHMSPRRVEITNPTFDALTADIGEATRSYFASAFYTAGEVPNSNWIQTDDVYLYSYGGHDYRIWRDQQAGSFITPQSNSDGEHGVGSPDAGKTNTQNLADNGVCVHGSIRPGGTTTLTGFSGCQVETLA